MTEGVRFKDVAQELTNHGYPVTPTNGKKAFLRGWTNGHPPEQVAELIEKHPDIGKLLNCGYSVGNSIFGNALNSTSQYHILASG